MANKKLSENASLIVLGNGFDLDLGWKTSYRDFITSKKESLYKLYGIDYLKEMIEGEYWYDLEGYMRDVAINKVTKYEDLSKLHTFWLFLRSKIFEYLCEWPQKVKDVYTTRIDSCAYAFIKGITKDSKIISFNYTDPFEKCGIETKTIEYIHGKLKNESDLDIRLGIDKQVLKENHFLNNDYIMPLIKSRSNPQGDNLISYWKKYETIIIYGHSLGQTDEDYFIPLFKNLMSGKFCNHAIYLITKSTGSLEDMKKNLKLYDIDYDDLICNADISTIFTDDGPNNSRFKELLLII